MPGYADMQKSLAELKRQYANETKRSEEEFNQKYEAFLEGQKDFAPSILKKRQYELQELLNNSVSFKKEAARLLEQAEADNDQPHDRAASESHAQSFVQGVTGSVGSTCRCVGSRFHAQKAGKSGEKTTGEEGYRYP